VIARMWLLAVALLTTIVLPVDLPALAAHLKVRPTGAGRVFRPADDPWPVSFVDVADRAGLRAPSIYGGTDRKRFIIETNGAGAAFLDYDNDGWVDAFVAGGVRLKEGTREVEPYAAGTAPTSHLYHNNHDGTFTDVTERAGLNAVGWASSICAGDYDNDGHLDLAITYYGQNVLYHNRGNGTFEDATRAGGLPTGGVRWGSGCTFVDYDRDGRLDLFIANYLRFDLNTAPEIGQGPNCLWKGIPVNCGPRGLPTDTNLLFHNEGGGRFTDVSAASGIGRVTGRYARFLRLLLMMPVLTPLQASSPWRREYSILGQRFITTVRPAASARRAASSLRTPSCIHTTLAPMAIASSTSGPAASAFRNTSTMSTLSGTSASAP